MLQKLPVFLIVMMFSLCLTSSFAANISFSGQTEVCPVQNYVYTASASNEFGARNGAFEWTFWRNNQLIGSFGVMEDCPSNPGTSTSSVTFSWGNVLGPVKIRIRFKGVNTPLCQFTSPDEKWIDVNVRVISPGPISGLFFCGPNETRTLSIPGVLPFNSAQSCYYHYQYDWIVPSGWSVIPTGGQSFTAITGGIRTFSTSVLVTSQSTPLASGYNGNYNIIVRSEPVWPWPTESTGKIWVGKPNSPGAFTILSGDLNNMCINSQAQVLISSVPGASSYVWTSNNPSGLRVEGSGLGALITGLTTSVSSSLGYWTFNYGGANTCGSTTALYGVVIKNCRAGGGGTLRAAAAAYPNPSNDSFTVKVGEEGSKEQAEVSLLNKYMERVYFIRTEEKEITISTSDLLPGLYYLNIATGKGITQQQIVISH